MYSIIYYVHRDLRCSNNKLARVTYFLISFLVTRLKDFNLTWSKNYKENGGENSLFSLTDLLVLHGNESINGSLLNRFDSTVGGL